MPGEKPVRGEEVRLEDPVKGASWSKPGVNWAPGVIFVAGRNKTNTISKKREGEAVSTTKKRERTIRERKPVRRELQLGIGGSRRV